MKLGAPPAEIDSHTELFRCLPAHRTVISFFFSTSFQPGEQPTEGFKDSFITLYTTKPKKQRVNIFIKQLMSFI